MNNLMIDLETMGNKPNAPIVSIGAVFFDPSTGELGPEFYRVVSLKSAIAGGAVPDPETIIWWMQQSKEARMAICDEDAIPISSALIKLNTFILDNSDIDKVQVWGNGATFDNVILRASYDRELIPCMWKFWNDRDVRTIVELGRQIGINPRRDIPFEGDMHNALADAKHQAKYVSAIWKRLIITPVNSEE
ncbi:3'-5' exoribonuclease [Salmonella enterica]|nr:3'-5' exoribonuclease [Salmonella enterica]EDU5436802.1 3'-5' exoribonuclease [Salmonella enterica subsp. enterica serovar Hadar]EBJ4878581.1 3'-5' exoribonuclease [Salmonella enterica]EBT8461060.1 3'-5' exoribonuclease [Salmonella enterica]ECE1009290.1 3'-5' exoribonuclease [Salmonella enterica]